MTSLNILERCALIDFTESRGSHCLGNIRVLDGTE